MRIFNRENIGRQKDSSAKGGWEGSLEKIIENMPEKDKEYHRKKLRKAENDDERRAVISVARETVRREQKPGEQDIISMGHLEQ